MIKTLMIAGGLTLFATPAALTAMWQTRKTVVISGADGSELAIPLKSGQTWASSELPPALADAGVLEISVR
jgi:hypothetical protein